jgi:hypothetical protein
MSSSDPNEFLARYERERREAERKARTDLRYAAGVLRLIGVERAVARFDGSGDEGFVEEVTYHPPPPGGIPEGLQDVIDDAVCELLPGGWEINTGSFGTVTLDAATGEPVVEQTWREEEEYDEDIEDEEEPG